MTIQDKLAIGIVFSTTKDAHTGIPCYLVLQAIFFFCPYQFKDNKLKCIKILYLKKEEEFHDENMSCIKRISRKL